MEDQRVGKSAPVGMANRIVILGFVLIVSVFCFAFLFRPLGLPGLATLGPVLGVVKFTDWLLSDRPAIGARTWVGLILAFFIAWPAGVTLGYMLQG